MKKIAVIGGGISGLASAMLLSQKYQVSLFEARPRLGGHTHTLTLDADNGITSNMSNQHNAPECINIDTGFMVFNRPNYPHLSAMFEWLGVQTYRTSMSFSVSLDQPRKQSRLEYSGSGLSGLFAQRRNLLSRSYWRMLADIVRFNRHCLQGYKNADLPDKTLQAFLVSGKYSAAFSEHYLLPMAASIWSSPTQKILDFPIKSFVRFFANHGLLNLKNRPPWETLKHGAKQYIEPLMAHFDGETFSASPVIRVERTQDSVQVTTQDSVSRSFDGVVFACHADQVTKILATPSLAENKFLSAFSYQDNSVYLHTDERLMPRSKRVWSAWNYLDSPADSGLADGSLAGGGLADGNSIAGGGLADGSLAHDSLAVRRTAVRRTSLTYWMNCLQDLATTRNYFVTLNPAQAPKDESVILHTEYSHPVFTQAALEAQANLPQVQGVDRLWFAGAYLGYGFHEDGLQSALNVAHSLSITAPWQHLINGSVSDSMQRVARSVPLARYV